MLLPSEHLMAMGRTSQY